METEVISLRSLMKSTETYTEPHAEADARMEAAQLAEAGVIYAPAADVRAMMRLLALDAGQTVQ